MHLHDFRGTRHTDNRLARFGDTAEHGHLALVNKAEDDGENDTDNPSNGKLVTINIGNTRIVLVGIPEIIEEIFQKTHCLSPYISVVASCIMNCTSEMPSSLESSFKISAAGLVARRRT